ncbi:MAG: tRNA (adenosine(37)-N6)-threonylcarbamoyltransferase complex ATPase subunit type 1 TsaE [Deltaproteobacteria bacterium]|nr:tRNA (adenosine(37)-N6)-threonylcarbamoyltransferase complex ATPase subunit type 1 TsaE [Deltaproteobacteria bacterium]
MPEQHETTSSTKQTEAVAARLARSILGGSSMRAPLVILLKGDLGAGKTTFVRGFVRALPGGEHVVVQSPTFALSRRYPTTPPVQHLDLYRLHDKPGAETAMRELGLDDDDAGGIMFVEWPVPSTWGVPVVKVEIQILSPRRRRVQISWS